ncbi:MAG: M14 family metallopeptidase [Chitinophagaceae bacterium]|jgi:hypothetical protein|nr:M14 family metallopeptidase [Chitinophagaceae bacterium]
MARLFIAFLVGVTLFQSATAQDPYFFAGKGKFNPSIPDPETFLGYKVGTQHTRHEKLVEYFRTLDRLSDRVTVTTTGETFEQREQILAIFTSSANHGRLEEIRKANLAAQSTGATENLPLVIHLGYNVHGNEPSSSEAAMLTAWYLTASQDPETDKWLNDMVILMDPVINPDGRDRHSHWANMHKAEPPVADPQDREHNEIWPGGRFNHYWFDLNRDWFLGTFPETRNRIRVFHQWRPYVQTDHHEMGTNSTFYFDPGKNSSNNPIVPDYLYNTIYPKFGEYFSKAANEIGSMYFTKEAFDKLYPGYGSSYINFYGGAGFLFEQGSSRGHVQETSTIPITFAFTIRNQFTASLATIRASLAEKASLLKLRKEFFRVASEQAKKSLVKGYVFGDPRDATRTRAFLDMLLMHQVDVYENVSPLTVEGKRFEAGQSWYVPVDQPNYIMVRSVFEKAITYTDSTFYDASTWSLVHAYGMPYAEMKTVATPGKKLTTLPEMTSHIVTMSSYAYVFHGTDYNSHRMVYALQRAGVFVQSAFRPFTAVIEGKPVNFGYGSFSIPVNLQTVSPDSIFRVVQAVSKNCGIPVYGLSTGFSAGGIDLGSNYMRTLRKPELAMIVGPGVSPPEAGEIWHLLDQRLQMPITKLDMLTLPRADLQRYNTIVMVSGNYTLLDKNLTDKIRTWVQNGGTLVTMKGGAEWAIRNGFTKERLLVDSSKPSPNRFNFDEASDREGSRAMGGSIFTVDLDTTHPMAFGYTSRKLSVYRNGSTFLMPSTNAYTTVAQYSANPLVGGYMHPETLKKVRNSAAILVGQEGRGRVILFSDDPNFRGTWYGTNKLFLNALFFGSLMNVPTPFGE